MATKDNTNRKSVQSKCEIKRRSICTVFSRRLDMLFFGGLFLQFDELLENFLGHRRRRIAAMAAMLDQHGDGESRGLGRRECYEQRMVAQALRRVNGHGDRRVEAEAREELLRRADQAIYDRRNASVEQERRIKENELNTEIAVEEKQRQMREAKVEADLAVEAKEQQVRESKMKGQIKVEEDRKQLVTAQIENTRAEADAQSYTIEASLRPLRDLDPNVLQMLAMQSAEPRLMISSMASDPAKRPTTTPTRDMPSQRNSCPKV